MQRKRHFPSLRLVMKKFAFVTIFIGRIVKRILKSNLSKLIVGGMPDAVKTYIATKDIREVDKVQRDIVALYKEDFSQYESEDKKLKLISIYDIIPAELNKQNKKFKFNA